MHLRWRIEHLGADLEFIGNIVPGLEKYAKNAVVFIAGARGKPHGYFVLQHANYFRHPVTHFEYLKENLARYIVRKVTDYGERLFGIVVEIGGFHLQEITLDNMPL